MNILDFEVWCEEIAVMGNAHLLITHQYHYARTLRSRHDPDGAVKLLEEAIEHAKEIQASFLAATCGLELVDVCTERKGANDKQLALDTLNMVQGEVNKFGVRFLKEEYERACEVVQSIK